METYLILPILINIFFIISNLIAAWGAINDNHLFIIPWLAAYFSYILFAFGLLLYMVIVLYHVWFKIVIFLIVSPILIIAIVFWLTLLELYFNIKIMRKKRKKDSKIVSTKLSYPSVTSNIFIPPNKHLPPPPAIPVPNNPPPAKTSSRRSRPQKKPSFLERHKPLFKRNANRSNLKHKSYKNLDKIQLMGNICPLFN